MEEEKKDNKGLKVILILFLLLCLAGSCVFIYKRISVKPQEKEEKTEEKIEIPNLSNILKMIPVKEGNNGYSSYKVSELTDTDIIIATVKYVINNSELTTKDNEKYYLEKMSNIEDNLFNFLGLENYTIKFDNDTNYYGYKLEKVTENEVDYLKVKTTELTGHLGGYELQDLDNITYDKENKEYVVNVLVIQQVSEGPALKIGKANIYLKSEDGKTTLEKLEFDKYNETDPIE